MFPPSFSLILAHSQRSTELVLMRIRTHLHTLGHRHERVKTKSWRTSTADPPRQRLGQSLRFLPLAPGEVDRGPLESPRTHSFEKTHRLSIVFGPLPPVSESARLWPAAGLEVALDALKA